MEVEEQRTPVGESARLGEHLEGEVVLTILAFR